MKRPERRRRSLADSDLTENAMQNDCCCDSHSPILCCSDATLGYENQPVVRNLNFEIYPGDYLSIIGENGSGKSTLMKTMLGLMKPLSGSITVNCSRGNGCIGYLPQQTALQKDFPATVSEVVLSGFLMRTGMRPFYKKDEKERAAAVMEQLHITELKKRSYRDLSGGQQQRVLLARALLAAHEILMLDEPVSGLDPSATSELYDTLAELNRKNGMTVIVISHDIAKTIVPSTKILHIAKDRYFFGTPAAYMANDLSRIFFPDD